MLFSKLYIATAFLAGTFAAPVNSVEKIYPPPPPPVYNNHRYRLSTEDKRALLTANDILARLADAGLAKRDDVDPAAPSVPPIYRPARYRLTGDEEDSADSASYLPRQYRIPGGDEKRDEDADTYSKPAYILE
ncbi:hypothetical protein F5Y04DRAFT_276043 [Hypomontagnella monticulosa]|nr:hypothetical protein F5Y04DRAFT_276043 [Hypomontagnella monticulosa]